MKLFVRGTGAVRKHKAVIFCWIWKNEGTPSIQMKDLIVWK